MPASQIGAQLYTLREYTKTPTDIAKTLARVKKMGYDAIQASALGPIEAKELAKIMQNEGLICAASHVPLEKLANEPEKILEEHKTWDCKYAAIGGFFQKEFARQDWLNFAARYNDIAKKYAGSGIAIGYHNHSHEMVKYEGKQALAILMEKLDPSIWFEIDTYWITQGGGDPVEWIGKVKNRIPCVHFKDMAVKTDRTQYMAEIGVGNLNWPAIIQACGDAGVKWYLIEQDICYRDPFDSLETSLNNLKDLGVN